MFEEILSVFYSLFFACWLRLYPRCDCRWITALSSNSMQTIESGSRQRMNGNRIAGVEPKRNRGLQLPLCRNSLCDYQDGRSMITPKPWAWQWCSAFGFWFAHRFKKLIKCSTVFVAVAVAVEAADNRDSMQNIYILEPDIAIHSEGLSSATRNAPLCSLDNNNQVLSYAPKDHTYSVQGETDRETPSTLPLKAIRDERDANRLPKLPIGLLPVIGGSIATVITFVESRARCNPRTVGPRRELSGFQTSLSTLRALLVGLAATSLLSLLELSLRLACY